MKIRRPAVAGYFYPADRDALDRTVTTLLDSSGPYSSAESVHPGDPGRGRRKAVIAPHAGYVYSGPIAATAYRWLADRVSPPGAGQAPGAEPSTTGGVARVVLIGPSHRVPFQGIAVSGADAFASPLGLVEVDRESVRKALALPFVHERDDAHGPEHSLEVHLPFLQRGFSTFRLVPLVAGSTDPAEIGATLGLLWGGPETVIVVSSDLSHYLAYDSALQMDRATADAIESLRPEDIGTDQACGAVAVRGLLRVAVELGLRARTLDLRNSGDTAGPKGRVVGYGAFGFEEAAA